MSEPDDVAGSLIDALASEGEAVDVGGFTLDPAKALEKLRAYQLADPHEWILLAISAGYVATGGRGPVLVTTGAQAQVRFAGISLGAALLERCFAAVFGREQELDARVSRLLALAANAALSLGAAFELESVEQSGDRHVLRVSSDGGQKIEHDRVAHAEVGVRISVRGRGQRRAARERELVLERCAMTSAAIILDGQRISRGPSFAMPRQRTDVLLGEQRIGRAAYEHDSVAPARALILNRGVLVETPTLKGCTPGFVAIVEVDLPMDLSQRQILRDDAWDALMSAIRAAHDRLPRPRARPSAAQDSSPPPMERSSTVLITALGFALLATIAASSNRSAPRPKDELRQRCESGEPIACSTWLEYTDAPDRRALALSCKAGNAKHCPPDGEALCQPWLLGLCLDTHWLARKPSDQY